MISCTPIFHSPLYIVPERDESIANATPFTAATAALYVTHPERKLSVREPSTAETELASKHPTSSIRIYFPYHRSISSPQILTILLFPSLEGDGLPPRVQSCICSSRSRSRPIQRMGDKRCSYNTARGRQARIRGAKPGRLQGCGLRSQGPSVDCQLIHWAFRPQV